MASPEELAPSDRGVIKHWLLDVLSHNMFCNCL